MPIDQIITPSIADGAVVTVDIANGAVISAKLDTAVLPIGVGQTWTNVLSSRASGVTYTNSTGRPIQLHIVITPSAAGLGYAYVYINGTEIGYFGQGSGGSSNTLYASFCNIVIPNGATYRANITGNASFGFWWELR